MSEHNCALGEAAWVGGDPGCASPIILRCFPGKEIQEATLFVTGLGYFEAKVNGQPVSEERFLPVMSDYEPRPLEAFGYPLSDTTTNSIYYCRFDITPLVSEGENTLSIQLGNGWYRQQERIAEGADVSFGEELKTIYRIVLKGAGGMEEFFSDGSETWRESEIVYNNLFIGERIDPAAGGAEKPVHICEAPRAELREQIGVPDRVIRRITPRLLGSVLGRKVFDAGENISGAVRLRTSAPKGEEIRLRFAEELGEGLELDFNSVGGSYVCSSGKSQIMTDVFTADGSLREFEPKFVWHAFRYFDVEGSFDSVEVLVIHSGVEVTAEFESPSEGLGFLLEAFLRTQLSNMHGSIPSDCPHRERLGYTGDGQVCAPAAMMLLDSEEFYRKWIRDILDCQDQKSGHVQHTAPLMGGGGGPGGWGCAVVLVPYAFYRQFGDRRMLETCYEPMRRWIRYLLAHSEEGLVVREEPGGWCLGDWCTLGETVIPEPFVNTCYLLKCLHLMDEIAAAIGRSDDRAYYAGLSEKIGEAVKNAYYDPSNGHYCGGVQGSDAYAVWAGLAGAETAARTAEAYDALGHLDTGFLGTDILLEVLMEYGYEDVVLKLLEGEELGSFLYMKRHGATTLWEDWDGKNSHSHPMFGACVRQLFQGFLGIRQSAGTAGYTAVEIAPRVPRKLDYARGSIHTPQGKIAVAWEKQESVLRFRVEIPEGVKAVFCYGAVRREVTGAEEIECPCTQE